MKAFLLESEGFGWVLGVTALIYNPVFPVHLARGIWTVINLVTIALALASVFILKTKPKQPDRNDQAE